MTLAYDHTNASPQIRPAPDVADFVKVGDIKSIGGREDECKLLEGFFQRVRMTYDRQVAEFVASAIMARKVYVGY